MASTHRASPSIFLTAHFTSRSRGRPFLTGCIRRKSQWKRKIKEWGIHKYEAPGSKKSLDKEIDEQNLSRQEIIRDPKYLGRKLGHDYRWGSSFAAQEKAFRNYRRRLIRQTRTSATALTKERMDNPSIRLLTVC